MENSGEERNLSTSPLPISDKTYIKQINSNKVLTFLGVVPSFFGAWALIELINRHTVGYILT